MNRKIQYTKRVIQENFLLLLKEKPIGKITVAEICAMADVNRCTFYQHYSDIYDLLEQLEDDLYNKFTNIQPLTKEHTFESITASVITLIYQTRELGIVLLGDNGDTPFLEKLLDFCRQNTFTKYKTMKIPEKDWEFIFTYVTSGCIGILRTWFDSDFKESQETIIHYIDQLSAYGYSAFGTQNRLSGRQGLSARGNSES